MKWILAVILFFAGAASLALSQTADEQETTKGEKAGVEQILLQMERDGNEATVKKDVATLSKLLAEDWIGKALLASKPKLRLWQTSNRRTRNSTPLTSYVTYPIGRWTRHSFSLSWTPKPKAR
jgi:hypothetical protein